MSNPFFRLKAEGRDYVPREGQHEYVHPDHYSPLRSEQDGPGDAKSSSSKAARYLAGKLIAMAMVMVGLLVAVIVIFT